MSSPTDSRTDSHTALRICPLCEATCGLTLTIQGSRVTGARGDRDDVFSQGFICPKGASFGAVDSDPDRLRTPLVRRDGELREATWAEAFDAVAAGIRGVVERYGPNSVGVVLGNPNVHTMAGALTRRSCSRASVRAASSPPLRSTRCPSTSPAGCCTATPTRSPYPTSTTRTTCCSSAPTPLSPTGVCAPHPTSPASSGRSRRAAARSPSSTRAAPAPPSSPTGTSRSAPVPTPSCSRL